MAQPDYATRDAQKELLKLSHRIDALNAACLMLADVKDPEVRREGQKELNLSIDKAKKDFFDAAAAYKGPYVSERF